MEVVFELEQEVVEVVVEFVLQQAVVLQQTVVEARFVLVAKVLDMIVA